LIFMGYFPMCVDIRGQRVLIIGFGTQTQDKIEKLRQFAPEIQQLETLTEANLTPPPALVVAGDLEPKEKERISILCREHNIPVNVVDMPALCSFFFPSLITRGDLTVAVSTGGKSPAAAAHLRQKLETEIPDRTGEILDWAETLRQQLKGESPEKRRQILKHAVALAFEKNRPLTEDEWNGFG